MKVKAFDAVKNKHEAARRIVAETEGMTVEEEVAYWAPKTEALLRLQAEVRRQQSEPAPAQPSGS